jgi:hypothetical protein
MMVERLNGRISVVIAAGGLLLVLLVGWLVFVSPQRSKANELAAEVSTTQTELAATQALLEGPELRQSTAELATLQTAIPDEIHMSQILRELSQASRDAQVRMLGITPQPVTSAGVANGVPMSVSIEGSYFAIRKFLRLLRSGAEIKAGKVQASGRLFAIDAIAFTGGSGEGSNRIQATLSVTAFAFRPVAPAGTIPDGTLSSVGGSTEATQAPSP